MIIFVNQKADMKKNTILILMTVMLLPSLSCVPNNTSRPDTIPLVRRIAADSTGQRAVVASYPAGAEGVVAVVGETAGVRSVVNRMLVTDEYDNINAALNPDGLPDFAGETIYGVADLRNESYDALLRRGEETVREAVVRSVVTALDTLESPAAKLIVLASPLSSAFGVFDVDTLFKMTGAQPRFIEPVGAILSAAGNGQNVLIATTASLTEAYTSAAEASNSSVHAFASEETLATDYLREVLVQYRDAGFKSLVTVIATDNYNQGAEAIRNAIEFLRSGIFPEDKSLSELVAHDCKVVDITSAIVRACYLKMRNDNIFTHNISYPSARCFGFEMDEAIEEMQLEEYVSD